MIQAAPKTAGQRVLVTGGAGFIGSHLAEQLLERGYRVICADNLLTGALRNIEHLQSNPRFEFVRADIVQPLQLEVDQIYNLACPASPKHYRDNPIQTIKTNVVGTLNMLLLAERTGARLLQASTSEVYGDPQVHPQPESYWGRVNPVGPRSCYDEGKRCAETLVTDFHQQQGVEVRIARIFNTYGPRLDLDDGRVISSFAVQALRGEPLFVHGDGSQTRSFCYVDDMVRGLIALMEYSGERASLPVNLGFPLEISITELAQTIARLARSSAPISKTPRPEDDPERRCPDISCARDILGWEPQVQLEQGLTSTIEYFRGRLEEERDE